MESSLAVAQARYWHLKQIELFADLDGPAMRELGEDLDTELVEAGDSVYRVGEPADRVYVLKSGRVKISRASSGAKEFILYLVGPGELFGELAVAGKEWRSGTATVLDDAFICSVERDRFERCMLSHPRLSIEVSRIIGRRKESTEKRVLDLISKDVRTRLAGALAELAVEYGVPDERGMRVDVRLTQTDLAQLVGSTRETTSTVFNEFRRENLVDSEGKTIWVLDPDTLGGYPVDKKRARPSGRAA